MEFKQAKPATIDQFQRPRSGANGCGCAGAGCLVLVIGMVVLCVGSYLALMHTSLPLALIENALESSGELRVEGLQGSVSSGFAIDKLEFASEDPEHWNELRGVKFSFNGIFDLMRHQRLIIEEASIGGATIYARFDDPEDAGNDTDPEIDWDVEGDDAARQVNEELQDLRRELQSEDWGDLKELRIDLVRANDIQIVNPETDARLTFEKVEFRNFQMLQGEIRNMGDIRVVSDQLDLVTGPSTRYPDEKLAWQLTGTAKSPVHKSVIADIPFTIDAAIARGNQLKLTASFCQGAFQIIEPYADIMTIELNDFSPAQYLDLTSNLVPANWTGTVVLETVQPEPVETGPIEAGEDKAPDRDGKQRSALPKARQLTVPPGGHFVLGKTRFRIEPVTARIDPDGGGWPPLVAEGQLDDATITAALTLLTKRPLIRVQLSAAGMEPRDIWARLFFDKPYVALDGDRQTEIDAIINSRPAGAPEPVEF